MMDWQAIVLTIKLATLVTCILLVIATPIAWWLSQSHHWLKQIIAAIVALPLVLPPTVLGFYLLITLGPQGPIGQLTQELGLGTLPFTFSGLVIGSVIYSLPFAVQPLQNTFEQIGSHPLEVAATLGASPKDRFFSIILPIAKPGFLTASVLTFAHTIGEFGVVLMLGGNIPGKTQVLSIAIYDQVEMLEYGKAHQLAAGMLIFSFIVLVSLYMLNGKQAQALK